MVMTEDFKEFLKILETQDRIESILGVWLYGGAAIRSNSQPQDIDIIVVSRYPCTPLHETVTLATGSPVSVNWIGPNSLSKPESSYNGGFFFSFKFLGPSKILRGNHKECERMLARAFSDMLFPWVFYLLPLGGESRLLTIDQLVALLFLLKIHINPHYAAYFSLWYKSVHFERIWEKTSEIIRRAVVLIEKHPEIEVELDNGHVRRILGDGFSEFQRLIRLELLVAGFWHFNSVFRGCEMGFPERYFKKQINERAAIDDMTMQSSLMFLLERSCLRSTDLPSSYWARLSKPRNITNGRLE